MPITARFVIRTAGAFLTVGFAALLLIVGMTIWLSNRAQLFTAAVDAELSLRTAASELRDALRTAESSQRGFVLTGNEIYLAPYDTAKSLAKRRLKSVQDALAGETERAAMLARLSTIVGEKLADTDRTIAAKTAGQDAEAIAGVRTNRGKALMDEANVFLNGIILTSDERLSKSGIEQRQNTERLRTVSIIGGVVIILVVAGVAVTVVRYAREIAQARDEVRAANVGLEERVQTRTADLARARERAEMLLSEVNHRVANSLQLVAALVKLQSNAVKDVAAKDALAETQGRITAISMVHKKLYTSGDVKSVALDDYLRGLLEHLETAMRAEGHTASLKIKLDPVTLPTDSSVNVGVVVTEWVTNAFKYAYPEGRGEIRVRLTRLAGGGAELAVEDDGVGRGAEPASKGTGLGSRIVNIMAMDLDARVDYTPRERGTTARLILREAGA
jgi:two-component sensor histidine kinase